MKCVFADTSYWVAMTDRKDSLHERAKQLSREREDCLLVTSDTVLTEYLNVFGERGEYWRIRAVDLVEKILKNSRVQVVAQTREGFMAAVDLYRNRPDKSYSLVDCDSMNIMRSRGIDEVLTEDRHFRQERFVPLLAQEQTS